MSRTLADSLGTSAKPEAYIGDPFPAAPTRIAVDGGAIFKDALTEPELDVKNVDTLLIFVDVTKGAATDIRLRVLWHKDAGFTDAQGFQETREDLSVPGQSRYELVEAVFTADFRGFVSISRLSRFCRIQHKGTGAPDGSSAVAVGIVGQARE